MKRILFVVAGLATAAAFAVPAAAADVSLGAMLASPTAVYGCADYTVSGAVRELDVDLMGVKPGATVFFHVDGKFIGKATADAAGRIDLELNGLTSAVPDVRVDSTIKVILPTTGTFKTLATGVFAET